MEERQAALTQTTHRTCRDIWKAVGRADGDLAKQGGALVLWELVLQTDQCD